MYEDFDFNAEDENIHDDTYRHKKKKRSYEEKTHIMDEVICILQAMIKIVNIVSEHIKDKK